MILRRSTNKDDFSLVKFAWVYHAEKSKQKKTHQKTPTYSRKKFLSDALFIDLFFMPSSKKKGHIALLLYVNRLSVHQQFVFIFFAEVARTPMKFDKHI